MQINLSDEMLEALAMGLAEAIDNCFDIINERAEYEDDEYIQAARTRLAQYEDAHAMLMDHKS